MTNCVVAINIMFFIWESFVIFKFYALNKPGLIKLNEKITVILKIQTLVSWPSKCVLYEIAENLLQQFQQKIADVC